MEINNDERNRLLQTIDALSTTNKYTYDQKNNRMSVTDKRENITEYTYDSGNVLTKTDTLKNVTSITYDSNNNPITREDAPGNVTAFEYDANGNLIKTTNALNNFTTTIYNAHGQPLSVTDYKGNTTRYNYDAEEGVITYIYDENGNRLSMTDPNENTTSYTYDAVNRLIRKAEAMGSTYRYTYDAQGNMTSHVDANGNTVNYTYDANDRLVKITYPDASTVGFTYDVNGNRISMVDSLGETSYTYDFLNRLTSYADPFGKSVGYGYAPNGNRTSITYPGGKAVTYSYDPLNRLIWVADWLSNKTNYAYNAAGRLTNILNPNNTTATYTYDTAGRLTQLLNAKSDQTGISGYAYTLDELGNHIQVVKDEPLAIELADSNITYTYDAENRLTDAGGTIHTYNANGNLTARGSDAFGYDFNNRLMQSNIDGMITQYNYDGLGNRLSKTANGTATRYILDVNGSLSNVLAEADDTGTITAYYVYGLGLISKILPDGTAWYYHYDLRGSTVAMTDAEETITDAYAYEPFGTLSNSAGSTQNPFKYVGRYGVVDDGNGLNYIRARYYAPEVGRFITKDPSTGKKGDSQSLNRYVYALNNPVMLIDISGFCAEEWKSWANTSGTSDSYHNLLLDIDEIKKEDKSITRNPAIDFSKLVGLKLVPKTLDIMKTGQLTLWEGTALAQIRKTAKIGSNILKASTLIVETMKEDIPGKLYNALREKNLDTKIDLASSVSATSLNALAEFTYIRPTYYYLSGGQIDIHFTGKGIRRWTENQSVTKDLFTILYHCGWY